MTTAGVVPNAARDQAAMPAKYVVSTFMAATFCIGAGLAVLAVISQTVATAIVAAGILIGCFAYMGLDSIGDAIRANKSMESSRPPLDADGEHPRE